MSSGDKENTSYSFCELYHIFEKKGETSGNVINN